MNDFAPVFKTARAYLAAQIDNSLIFSSTNH
ncbi:hypothetical protein SEI61121_02780 [Salmonella enterica subsp. indica serovar 6,14,25:z10:1,(2),7 str. 1121]|uniref:Uncharacterized protein n=1 Tax=Salmonella enterica subsp. indica serovar 6,14,25:z10:1,(2),7 str. 1121 TaxID=1173950 RepID=V1H4Y4_SALER|nr:hypothetical protein SEI61121_02780 [Salmonella enterica subsp. indica serovar 6,14,25:z10:1,(2),7 str. 1121]